jgi:C1A family cysteine protease
MFRFTKVWRHFVKTFVNKNGLPQMRDLLHWRDTVRVLNGVSNQTNGKNMKKLGMVFYLLVSSAVGLAINLPSHFDLRDVDGNNYVTSVKSQLGGTSWAYAALGSVESNLMRTGHWAEAGEVGEAALSENHMDWWNGFNEHYNADASPTNGGTTLAPHRGGDYRMAAAYLARGEGAIEQFQSPYFSVAPEHFTDPFFNMPPEHYAGYYRRYYVRDIEWLTAGADLSNINDVKQTIINHGSLATAISWSQFFYSSQMNSFYQPAFDAHAPHHGVTIVGWDDAQKTQAPHLGAWLARNNWGTRFGQGGYFWVSYDDKVVAKDPLLGAVSFNHAEPLAYANIYYHDYHGWRDTTKPEVQEAFNAFIAKGGDGLDEDLKSVSFYTAAANVHYIAKVYGKFDGQQLSAELANVEGDMPHLGHHTVNLPELVSVKKGQHFFVYLKVSQGGQAMDRTSRMPTLLGSTQTDVVVQSTAKPGESFYLSGTKWIDLNHEDPSANFCMKALSVLD